MPEQLFAYTLSQVDEGWSWSLWDEDGAVVAAGVAPDQPSAERGLSAALAQTRSATPPRQGPPQRPRNAEPRPKRPARTGAAHPHAGW
jgi:hypothetical protein